LDQALKDILLRDDVLKWEKKERENRLLIALQHYFYRNQNIKKESFPFTKEPLANTSRLLILFFEI
jgi:hypothetical protein